jgi:hypothetical protein
MNEALAWKHTIEQQIANLEKIFLPAIADPTVISNIIGLSAGGGGWKRREFVEGVRIMEQDVSTTSTKCMKAQVMVHTAPFQAFLAIMDGKFWPHGGTMKVLETIDDHADILGFEVKTTCKTKKSKFNMKEKEEVVIRKLCLTRFWKKDDDGIYLIAFNNASHNSFATSASFAHTPDKAIPEAKASVDAVITVSPRKDRNVYDDDVSESLICCTVQGSAEGWLPGEMDQFLTNFLTQHLLELRYSLLLNNFSLEYDDHGHYHHHGHTHTPDIIQVTPTTSSGALVVNESRTKPTLLRTRSGHLGTTKSSRGIMTVQPGMEDTAAAANAFGELTRSNSSNNLDRLDRPPSQGSSTTAGTNAGSNAGHNSPPGVLRKYLSTTTASSPPAQSPMDAPHGLLNRHLSGSVDAADESSSTAATSIPGKEKEKKKRTIFGSAYSRDKDKEKEKDSKEERARGNVSPSMLRKMTSTSETSSVGPVEHSSSIGSMTSDANGGISNTSSSGRKSPSISSTGSSSRRKSANNSVAVNTRAAQLRDEIACKEYEVARLEKQLNLSSNSAGIPQTPIKVCILRIAETYLFAEIYLLVKW